VAAVLLDRDFSHADPAQLVGPPEEVRDEGIPHPAPAARARPELPVIMVTGVRDLRTRCRRPTSARLHRLGGRHRPTRRPSRRGCGCARRARRPPGRGAGALFARWASSSNRRRSRGSSSRCTAPSPAARRCCCSARPARARTSWRRRSTRSAAIRCAPTSASTWPRSTRPDRERAVRPRARRLHGRAPGQRRQDPLRAWRHALPERDRRPLARVSGQAADRARAQTRSCRSARSASYPAEFRLVTAASRDLALARRAGRCPPRPAAPHRLAHPSRSRRWRARREDPGAGPRVPERERSAPARRRLRHCPRGARVPSSACRGPAMSASARRRGGLLARARAHDHCRRRARGRARARVAPAGAAGSPPRTGPARPRRAPTPRRPSSRPDLPRTDRRYFRYLVRRTGGRLPEVARLARIAKGTAYQWWERYGDDPEKP